MNTSISTREDRSYYAWGGVLLAISIIVRLFVYPIISGDYTASISHWLDALGSPGLSAFRTPFSDYAPLYLYFLKVITLIPIYQLLTVKTLSVIFDVILGLLAILIVKRQAGRAWSKPKLLFVFTLIFIIPTVILNSSAWAQADSIYTAFVLLSLYYMLEDRPLAASIALSVALSFKLQAVFFLPVLIAYLLPKKWSLLYLVWIPVIYVITIIPAWLSGGSFWQLLGVYGQQSSEFQALTLSAPSVFSFINENGISSGFATFLSYLGILIALIFAGWIIRKLILIQRHRMPTTEKFVLYSLLSAVALPFFLPHMHERYFYVADVLSMIYACMRPRRWYLPVLIIGASLFSYFTFLSSSIPFFGPLIVGEWVLGLVMLVALVCLIVLVTRSTVSDKSANGSENTEIAAIL